MAALSRLSDIRAIPPVTPTRLRKGICMREMIALLLLGLLLGGVLIAVLVYARRRRTTLELRRGHGDYSKLKRRGGPLD